MTAIIRHQGAAGQRNGGEGGYLQAHRDHEQRSRQTVWANRTKSTDISSAGGKVTSTSPVASGSGSAASPSPGRTCRRSPGWSRRCSRTAERARWRAAGTQTPAPNRIRGVTVEARALPPARAIAGTRSSRPTGGPVRDGQQDQVTDKISGYPGILIRGDREAESGSWPGSRRSSSTWVRPISRPGAKSGASSEITARAVGGIDPRPRARPRSRR